MKTKLNLRTLSQTVSHVADSLLFTSFNDTERTVLTGEDAEYKEDILDFINDSISDYGKHIFEVFTNVPVTDPFIAIVDDIYKEGVLIRYLPPNAVTQSSEDGIDEKQTKRLTKQIRRNSDSTALFIPFRTKSGDPFRRLYMLGAEAQIRLGILDDIVSLFMPSLNDKRDFTITKTEFITKNMIRLYIKSETALPKTEPGYAYQFAITKSDNTQQPSAIKLLNLPIKVWKKVEPELAKFPYVPSAIHNTKKYALLTALEVYKRIPASKQSEDELSEQELIDQNIVVQSEQEQAETNTNKKKSSTVIETRYYTLRQLKSNTDPLMGEVDIYIHEGSPGSEWAKSLQAGDSIRIDAHYEETIKNMTIGQPLFICDETSMPSVAAMLERWEIDTVPIVISITNDKADFSYFEDMMLPDKLKDKLEIMYINAHETDNLADAVIAMIKQTNTKIDCAWGAIGKADFRPIKKYLREEHGLKGKLNRVRAYWV